MNEDLARVIGVINKRAKRDLAQMGDQPQADERISSGSLSLDVGLGGGWPVNRWTELIGEESSGKTTVALKTIAHNQAQDPEFTAVWVVAEEFDEEWATVLGVDITRVVYVDTNVMEDAYQAVLDFVESKAVDLVVLDSLAALSPAAEDEKSMEESTVGRGALLTNKFFRKALVASRREPGERGFSGLVINQWRQKIGVMYGDPRTTPGGVGKNYAFSIRAEIKRDEWIEEGTGEAKVRVGQRIKLRTIKNKTAAPHRSAVVDFYFDDGGPAPKGHYDFGRETVSLSLYYGIVTRGGPYYNFEGTKWRGTEAFLTAVRTDDALRERLEKEVLTALARKA